MFDKDRTGTINMYEFRDLFNYINQWKATFESIDSDRSGFIEFPELTRCDHYLQFFSPCLFPGPFPDACCNWDNRLCRHVPG